MPRVSIFTPSHKTRWLIDCYDSLEDQTFTDWEWVVGLNGAKASNWRKPNDDRIKTILLPVNGIGALKQATVAACEGDILVELDHDDILAPTALEKIVEAFDANPEVGLVYSDCAQINENGSYNYDEFNAQHGWEYRRDRLPWYADLDGDGFYDGEPTGLYANVVAAMEPTPHNVSYIWYAPNHVRAFRRSTYELAGGYNPGKVVLDDQDLMTRIYQIAPFHHISECLYLQRVHSSNTQRDETINAQIQVETVEQYDQNLQGNLLAWAKRENLECLDLGAAHNPAPGYTAVDLDPAVMNQETWRCGDAIQILSGMADNSIGAIRAVDFLEHVTDKIELFNEMYRVLAPGGMLLSLTPSTDGRGAFQDPTHVSFYNEHSFWYYTDDEFRKFVPEITARFQVSRLFTFWPRDGIAYVCANLVKPTGPRNGGLLSVDVSDVNVTVAQEVPKVAPLRELVGQMSSNDIWEGDWDDDDDQDYACQCWGRE